MHDDLVRSGVDAKFKRGNNANDLYIVPLSLAAGRARAEEPHPIMPRLRTAAAGPQPCLLLPWDPEYVDGGTGDSAPLAYRPRWAIGPSRFVLEDRAWKHVAAPGSTTAG